MAGNNIVTTTVNKVTWDTDQSAYGKAMKQIKSLKKEWEKAGTSLSKGKVNPAAGFMKSAAQAKMVTKRLAQVERAEQAKTTNYSIAQTKKRLRAEEALSKQHAQRRAQTMRQMTARDPELVAMRKHYEALQKQKTIKTGFPGSDWKSPNRPKNLIQGGNSYTPGGPSHLGGGRGPYDPSTVQRQNRQMAGTPQRTVDPAAARAQLRAQKKRDAEDAAYNKLLTSKETTIGDNSVRLRAKYGNNANSKIGGKSGKVDALNEKFLNNNSMKASTYRAELASLEKQFRATNSAGLSFADGMTTIRRSMIGLTAAYTAFSGAASILATGQFFQGMQATMLMVSDSSTEAGQRMEFVQKQAYRLGLDLKIASQGYTQMAIAADGVISKQQNNDLFKGFSEYATALQVDPVKYQRGITAIQQMLGKGQIMSEELKQQLSEAIPGSMKVFVQAAQKYFKDDKIGVPELLDLMKNGKLLAKDILPLVGQAYAEAANKGGALEKSLKGNRVAMQRMGQAWINFQNKIFESGFGDKMTEVFNNIAKMLSNNGPMAENLGAFATGVVTAFSEIFYTVHDVFIAVGALIDTFLKKLGIQMGDMKEIFNFLGMGLGALFLFNSLTKVFGILSKIAGLGAGLAFLKNIFGAGGGDDEGGGDGKKNPKKKKGMSGRQKLAGLGILGVIAGLDQGFENSQDPDFYKKVEANNNRPSMWSDISNWWSGMGAGHESDRLNYLSSQGMMPGGSGPSAGAGGVAGANAPIEGEITLKIDAGELSKMIDAQIDTSNMQNINMLINGLQN